MSALIDLTGKTFGRWTVLRHVPGHGSGRWLCRCICNTKSIVQSKHLRTGRSISCGCLRTEQIVTRSTTHGHAGRTDKSAAYKTWCDIIRRCDSTDRKDSYLYNLRGINVCDGFRVFENFLADMGERPDGKSIDRKDNDKSYDCGHCKDCKRRGATANCRWATSKQQMRNTRRNHLVTIAGETHCLSEWAEIYGVSRDTFKYRINAGWEPLRALTAPVANHSVTTNAIP